MWILWLPLHPAIKEAVKLFGLSEEGVWGLRKKVLKFIFVFFCVFKFFFYLCTPIKNESLIGSRNDSKLFILRVIV
jgi:hypothetical protein